MYMYTINNFDKGHTCNCFHGPSVIVSQTQFLNTIAFSLFVLAVLQTLYSFFFPHVHVRIKNPWLCLIFLDVY